MTRVMQVCQKSTMPCNEDAVCDGKTAPCPSNPITTKDAKKVRIAAVAAHAASHAGGTIVHDRMLAKKSTKQQLTVLLNRSAARPRVSVTLLSCAPATALSARRRMCASTA
jgi:hypothetical protein